MNLTRKNLSWAIRVWWNERIAEGCQLEFLEDSQEGIDWAGDDLWKKRVALHALLRDFNKSRSMDIEAILFGQAFNDATMETKRKQKYVVATLSNGREGLRLINCVVFGKKPLTLLAV